MELNPARRKHYTQQRVEWRPVKLHWCWCLAWSRRRALPRTGQQWRLTVTGLPQYCRWNSLWANFVASAKQGISCVDVASRWVGHYVCNGITFEREGTRIGRGRREEGPTWILAALCRVFFWVVFGPLRNGSLRRFSLGEHETSDAHRGNNRVTALISMVAPYSLHGFT